MFDLVKDNMVQERKWNSDIIQLLKDQIDYLKNDIIHKNTIIESVMFKIANNNNSNVNESTFVHSTTFSDETDETDVNAIIHENSNANVEELSNSSKYSNRYQVLINDEESDFEKEFENNVNIHILKTKQGCHNPEYKQTTPFINPHPENDIKKYSYPKHIPGNSSYADIANYGKKILILSDSICSRIKLREFNSYINNGTAYRKSFPGATPKELAHYCTHSFMEDKPDTCIIHVGTNRLSRDDPLEIHNDIINIVKLCHSYGVKNVYISSIAYRPHLIQSVRDTNDLLRANQLLHDSLRQDTFGEIKSTLIIKE